MIGGFAFDLPPEAAISFFLAKGLRRTFSWQDMLMEEHAVSFTVAKMISDDLLADVKTSLDAAIATGQSFDDWSENITKVLQTKGWWGKQLATDPVTGERTQVQLGSPGRLKTIFRTNMQAAYSAGAWEKIQEQAEYAEYLMYDAVDDFRTRPEHAAWDDKVYRVDDVFWETHYPPNGWNCRCGVIQLSSEELVEYGLSPSEPADISTFDWKNPRTGKTESIPVGIDPGFNYNPGKQRLAELEKLSSEKGIGRV